MPADDYTPTTEQVRRYWQYGANAWMAGVADDRDEGPDGSIAAEFDRWLAAHDARVRRDAAREALAQEPTDGEQAARFAVESKHHLYGTQCRCGFESHRARSRTEHIMTHYFDELSAARAEGEKEGGDEHHTLAELYDYRMLYNAHAVVAWQAAGWPVVKSWRHADGELCFGGGWFIVTAQLPTGQVSNHYAAEHWDRFAVPEFEAAPDWDGHTPQEAAGRLRAALTTYPATEGER